MAGIASALKPHQQAIGFSALKGAEYLTNEVSRLMVDSKKSNFEIVNDYHFGGYAKTTFELFGFKNNFERQFITPLDYVYTSKMMFGVFDMIRNSKFKEDSIIVAIHTGGLQGNVGFEK